MSSVRIGGVVFQLFPVDHEPRHVHALYAGIEVAAEHFDELVAVWEKLHP